MSNPTAPADEPAPPSSPWSVAEAEALYRLPAWGEGFFHVNEAGHVAVTPRPDGGPAIDLPRLVEDLRARGLRLPALVRFQDILRTRVERLNAAFAQAIEEAGYRGGYQGVYPIKVNQLHEVVLEVLEAGQRHGTGLECGSKAELVATLAHLEDDATLLVCNGVKDAAMLGLVLAAQKLGKRVLPVVEKHDEAERLLALAAAQGVTPRFGVRVRLATRGAGKWAESGGDASKFGISIPELVALVARLRERGLEESLCLLHCHLGSQVSDIAILRQAVRELARIHVELVERGIGLRYLDVGGGLGVHYASGYAGEDKGINYTLQEYANCVVNAVHEVCEQAGLARPPVLVTECGRALTAHHSVLVVEALGAYRKDDIPADFAPAPGDHALVHSLAGTRARVQALPLTGAPVAALAPELVEALHEALQGREDAESLFALGYLPLEQKALVEQLHWSILRGLRARAATLAPEGLPGELRALDERLVEQYLCNFSVFQSCLDHWAIGQGFPIVPLARLRERPERRAVLVDLTCDSDGRFAHYVSSEPDRRFLPVHPLEPGRAYLLGFFLVGAYQDILGDAHNLLGRVTEAHVYADAGEPGGYYVEKIIAGQTVEQMLGEVQYFPNDLERRMNALIRAKVEAGVIRPREGVELLARYRAFFQDSTYLAPAGGEK